jgi:hypothetical protein
MRSSPGESHMPNNSSPTPPVTGPALTPEEWERTRVDRIDRDDLTIQRYDGPGTRLFVTRRRDRFDQVVVADDDMHALAALALYGQPFGFTQEDVAFLRTRCFFASHGIGCMEEGVGPCRYCDIANRIESLLPPTPTGEAG